MSVLFCFILSILQATEQQTSAISDLLLRASPIAKGVLVLLLLLSLGSWSIIFSKLIWFKRAERASDDFLRNFRTREKLSDVFVDADSNRRSPVARVFLAGYDEIANQINVTAGQLRSLEAVTRVLQSAAIAEVSAMERSMSWLASTANASPFIGLFGTVIGIILAFHGLSTATASSIQAVAPGIAEALIATAAGIAAAVPAAVSYNYFLNRIKLLTSSIDRFSLELVNFLERRYVRVNSLSG